MKKTLVMMAIILIMIRGVSYCDIKTDPPGTGTGPGASVTIGTMDPIKGAEGFWEKGKSLFPKMVVGNIFDLVGGIVWTIQFLRRYRISIYNNFHRNKIFC